MSATRHPLQLPPSEPGNCRPEPRERIIIEVDLTALIEQLIELYEELRAFRRERAERLFRRED